MRSQAIKFQGSGTFNKMEKKLDIIRKKVERKMMNSLVFNPDSSKMSGQFVIGGAIVTFTMTEKGKEFELWNPEKERYYDIIAEWLNNNTLDYKDIEIESYNRTIWDDNGFRDEADFIKYKFNQ